MARYAPSDLVSIAVQLLISFQIHSPLSSSHTVQAMDSARSSYEDDAAALKNATGPCVPAHSFFAAGTYSSICIRYKASRDGFVAASSSITRSMYE